MHESSDPAASKGMAVPQAMNKNGLRSLLAIGAAALLATCVPNPPLPTVAAVDHGRDAVTFAIAANEPKRDEATLEALLARAAALGFDQQAFIRTPHARAAR